MSNIPLFIYVFIPILMGLFFYIFKAKYIKFILVGLETLLLMSIFFYWKPISQSGYVLTPLSHFMPSVGMTLKMDQLSFVLMLLNNLIFIMMFIFSLRKKYSNPLFVFLFLSLQGIINGVFLSTDLFNIYLLIELATLIVSILIMFKKDGRSFYDGMIYLMINMVGMAFFLMGVAYIYKVFGVLSFEALEHMIIDKSPKELILPFAFLMTGVSLKAAFMPLFSWLPKAHGTASAPTVVSAILSGIFVKTGVYLFIRISSMFEPIINMSSIFFVVGLITVIIGGLFAFVQSDLKLILSYSTISQVGLIMLGLTQSEFSQNISIFYILNHGILKALFFITIGILIDGYQTRNVHNIKGIYKQSKFIAIIIIIILLGITGNPIMGTGLLKQNLKDYLMLRNLSTIYYFLMFTTMLYTIPILKAIFSKKLMAIDLKLKGEQRFALAFMAGIVVAIGILSPVLMNVIWHDNLKYNIGKVLSQQVIYGMMYLFAYIVYHLTQRWAELKEKIASIDFSFNTINGAILIYFVSLTVIVHQMFL
ncbi:MAG: hypothetical protein JXR88_05250 [Clostridia bacterium]|nr:hypothetical protein [Clostridia bacterium]